MKTTERKPQPVPDLTTQDIARLVGGTLEGDPAIRIRGIAPLDQAQEQDLGFLAQRRYLKYLDETRARALLVTEDLREAAEGFPGRVIVPDAYQALARLLESLFPPESSPPGIHPTAVFGKGVKLGSEVRVDPYAVLGEDVIIGDRVRIGAHCVIGDGCQIGDDSVLHPQVVAYPGTRLGSGVILHAGVRLGVDGFGYVSEEGEHRKVPQVGGCEVEDGVEIGANSCIDRGSIGRTMVERGSKLDNLVHLAHNVHIGKGVLLAAMVGIAGSTRVGDGAMFGGQAGLVGHIEIGEGARIGAQAGVIGDIPAGETVSGYPARNNREFLRAMAMAFKLPETLKRLGDIEHRLTALEAEENGPARRTDT
jgi:UDP-3-O-[3-hydroxymyristoyl] glucosamine N-acyltransferase